MTVQAKHFYAFGPFRLDSEKRVLVRDGVPVAIAPKAAETLIVLVENAGRLVTKEELMRRVWPDAFVEEANLPKNILVLRKLLGERNGGGEYIETIAKRGYRFVVPVEEVTHAEEGISSPIPAGSSLIGKKVSHYRVLEIVGGGGMGLVYKAEDLKLGRRVALKFLPEEFAGDPIALQRFEREARTASSLNHPNICSIYEFGEHDGQPFLVMELLEGETLRERLASMSADRKSIPLDELLKVAMQVADGLEAAHEKGIIHRDIKPANIFLTKKGTAKILDFGLAKLAPQAEGDAEQEDLPLGRNGHNPRPDAGHTLTHTGTAMGTAGYMSPEQVRGEKLDARTDLFSFGLVLYEMATGQRAFSGPTAAILKNAILNHAPTPVREMNSAVPPKLEQLVSKAMEKNRGRRYQSAAEMRAALDGTQDWSISFSSWKVLVPAVIVTVAVAAVLLLLLRPSTKTSAKLTANDTIVLAEFSNTTGDSIFDGTLRRALDIDLQQSPSIGLLSERKITEALLAMNRPPAEALTPAVARDVCLKTQSRAVLTGSIANRGNSYLVGLRAADCQTGEMLADISTEAENRERVVHALGEAGSRLRTSLGDPTTTQRDFDQPLESTASPSLDALQEYDEGLGSWASEDSGPHLKRAIDLDPNFALAYQQLGRHYMANWQSELAAESFAKAYALRGRLGLRHKLGIVASYYMGSSGEVEKAVQTFYELLRTFPESGARNQLCFALRRAGRLEQSVAVCREAIRFNRSEGYPIANAIFVYVSLDRLLDAQAILDEAEARMSNPEALSDTGYTLAFARGDRAAMQRYFNLATTKAGVNAGTLFFMEAYTQTYYGHAVKARQLWQQAVASVDLVNARETAAGWRAREALVEAELGNGIRARQLAAEALALSSGRDVKAMVALTLARAGDTAGALKLVDQLNRDFPRDTLLQSYELPLVQASVELQRHHSRKTIDILLRTTPYEQALTSLFPTYFPPYVRGQAYLQGGQSQQATAEFQKVLDHPGLVGNHVAGALAHFQIARAQTMMGDKDAARKSYQNFLTLWKDADPDLPVLRQAKAEYAKLQ
jgi:serine/threonine protein kinase/tetratricopeptide (TPR) repeat protein